jgi:hypothetical protein
MHTLRTTYRDKTFCLLFLALALAGVVLNFLFWRIPPKALLQEDTYYIWLEGKRIISGENPYARVLAGNMRVNDKYATYFPVAYLLSALLHKLGFSRFEDWIYMWRPLSFIFQMGIVALILQFFSRRGLITLGFAAALIILLGRWSIYIIKVQQLEFAAIFFLLFSLTLLSHRPKLSLLMFSLSLGIKQIAIFCLPLYLIYLWKQTDPDIRTRNTFLGLLIIASIPMATSIPFLIWNAEGFVKSVLFSATRYGDTHVDARSIDLIIADRFYWFVGLKAKSPMLFVMAIIYLGFLKEKAGVFISCTLIMMVFVYFNSVVYLQYFIWYICLIPFALVETIPVSRGNSLQPKKLLTDNESPTFSRTVDHD